MIKWYKQKALEIITERAKILQRDNRMEVYVAFITGAQKRWGSCGPKGALHFSWRLVMAPQSIIDYVVVHELDTSRTQSFPTILEQSRDGHARLQRAQTMAQKHGAACTL